MILFLVLLMFSFLGLTPAAAAEPQAQTSAAAPEAEYYCPMHPQIVRDKPGQCPICFMNLVRRTADRVQASSSALSTHAVVGVDSRAAALLGVRTETVSKRALEKTLRLPGFVVHDEELFNAQIEHIKAIWSQKTTDKELYKSIGPRWYSLGPKPKESTRIALMRLGMDEESIDALTPSSQPDFRLLHLKEMGEEAWIYAPALTGDAALVRKGDRVTVQSAALPGASIQGTVEGIAPFADPETRTVRIRILVREKGTHLVPDTPVTVIIRASLGETLAVPESAVLYTGEKKFVFVRTAGGYEPRAVRLGRNADGYHEILEGLTGSEEIAANGTFFLDSESRLQATFLTAAPGGRAHD